ncbi:MAG: alpha/beta fold hydrolase [Alphaproteobacteria bacterium]
MNDQTFPSVAAEDQRVRVGGDDIAVRWLSARGAAPDAPVIVFLHEGLGSIGMWMDFPQKLIAALDCRGLIYERNGHGRTLPIRAPRAHSWMHDEAWQVLPALLECLGVVRPVLFSHSDGATIALLYASRFKPRGVVSEAAHIYMDELAQNGLDKVEAQRRKGSMRDFLKQFHPGDHDAMVGAWLDFWREGCTRNWNMVAELAGISCPLLAIQGELDEYGTTRQLDDIVAGVGGPAERLLIPGCGHVPHLQAEELVFRTSVRFIRPLLSNP